MNKTKTTWTVLQRSSQKLCRHIVIGPTAVEERTIILQDKEVQEEPTSFDRAVQWLREQFRRTMLPVGYPDTVHPNYIKFNAWSFVQGVVGSANGVLSTQCLLVGLGMSNSSTSAVIGGSSIALAATLNWILKDGIGNLGGVLFVSHFGARFDKDAKRYRFFSAVAMNIATLLEIVVPLFPKLFLPLASIANTFKSVSWMANSATRAQMQRHFTKLDNLGDLTGKAASVNTAAVVCGTGLGVTLSSLFLSHSAAVLSPESLITRCLLLSSPLILMYLWTNYKGCVLGVSPRLSLQRLDMVLNALASSLISPRDNSLIEEYVQKLERYILSPTNVGVKERFLCWDPDALASISFEPSADALTRIMQSEQSTRYHSFFENHQFISTFNEHGRLAVWFAEKASPEHIVASLLSAYIAKLIYAKDSGKDWLRVLEETIQIASASIGEERLIETLKSRSWDLSCLDLDRRPILIESN